mmetsp:Transcript_23753/g.75290  ORF Transcript_23753/g.75290 Transcript_23753/m.75290 type:complete len:259 (+) Transcript_23753:855-1631(+)
MSAGVPMAASGGRCVMAAGISPMTVPVATSIGVVWRTKFQGSRDEDEDDKQEGKQVDGNLHWLALAQRAAPHDGCVGVRPHPLHHAARLGQAGGHAFRPSGVVVLVVGPVGDAHAVTGNLDPRVRVERPVRVDRNLSMQALPLVRRLRPVLRLNFDLIGGDGIVGLTLTLIAVIVRLNTIELAAELVVDGLQVLALKAQPRVFSLQPGEAPGGARLPRGLGVPARHRGLWVGRVGKCLETMRLHAVLPKARLLPRVET